MHAGRKRIVLDKIICSLLMFDGVKSAEEEARINKKRSKKAQRKYEKRKKTAKVEPALEEQFVSGRLLGT